MRDGLFVIASSEETNVAVPFRESSESSESESEETNEGDTYVLIRSGAARTVPKLVKPVKPVKPVKSVKPVESTKGVPLMSEFPVIPVFGEPILPEDDDLIF